MKEERENTTGSIDMTPEANEEKIHEGGTHNWMLRNFLGLLAAIPVALVVGPVLGLSQQGCIFLGSVAWMGVQGYFATKKN